MTPTSVPVNLSDAEWEALVATFIRRAFLPESAETYDAAIAEGKSHVEAVINALRNEAANDALIETVSRDIVKELLADLDLSLELANGPLDNPVPLSTIFAQQADTQPFGDPFAPQEFFDLDFDFPPEPQPPVPSKQLVTLIWVTFQKEGIHCYPAAGTDPNLATGDEYDVSFLASPHRHMFHFRVGIEVFHDDRDIEFIQFKRWLERLYTEGTLELNFKSCEMIAQDLHAVISGRYPGRKMTIDVSEDGENGATILFDR
jgi:hypothetical protein